MHKPNSSMMTRADINHDLIPSKDILMSVANPSYSPIKKLKIEDINDLKLYIEDLLVSQLIDATIINGILKSRAFPDVQITIELE